MKIFRSKSIAMLVSIFFMVQSHAQVIISQYYEGTGTNKWIELTNLGNTSVNTTSPQLRLGIWSIAGSTGNITFTGAPSATLDLNVVIPAKGSVLIGNPINGTEISYLSSASAVQTSTNVIGFNGNDGVALLNASNTVLDRFGTGINAADISYVRKTTVTAQSTTYVATQWTSATIATVQAAASNNVNRLGFHLLAQCVAPNAPTALTFSGITTTNINGAFTASNADGYLVVRSTASTLSALPVDGTTYTAGASLGGGTVVSVGNATSFASSGLTAATTYYYFVFGYNDQTCTGAPAYQATSLVGNATTSTAGSGTGTLNYYFGNLHAHSSYSDGNKDDLTKIPSDDYAFAKTSLCMDFLGLSEHNHTGAGMQLSDWQPGIVQAQAATAANFVALHGMEWGVISGGGHVIVYGLDSLIGWEANQYQIFVAKNTYTGSAGLFNRVNLHGGNAIAYLAHPNSTDFNNLANGAYDVEADNAVVGTNVETGPAFSTNITYTNPASMGDVGYYQTLLSKGYHVGPTIDHDNHNLTFGKTTKSRLVIMAASLSEANLLDGMKRMRFYASEDCSAKINFTLNTQPMGSDFRGSSSPVISVGTITTNPVNSIKLMFGIAGSGSVATMLTSSTTGSLNFTHTALGTLQTGYYYCDITETDGTRILTSPIWYTKDAIVLRSNSVNSFFAVNEKADVLLKWTAENEAMDEQYIVERSTDGGRTFEIIKTIEGVGKQNFAHTYAMEDMAPKSGLLYYRLTQKNQLGQTVFSSVKVVDRSVEPKAYFTAFPNPVQGVLYIEINAMEATNTNIEVFDQLGRRLQTQKVNLTEGLQNEQVDMSKLPAGAYIVKLMLGNQVLTKLVNKL
jgi:Secretion system C-terminal sorting domain/Lamin Tail Domain